MVKVLKSEWRSGRDSVGIILCELASGNQRAYIGVSKIFDDPNADAQEIANWGCKLSYGEAKAFFPEIEESNYEGGLGSV